MSKETLAKTIREIPDFPNPRDFILRCDHSV